MAKTPFKNSIENVYNRMIIYSLITSILSIIVGLVLIFLPTVSNKVVGIIVGVIILIFGINAVYKYFHRDGAKIYSLNIVFGVLYSILGVVIILYPYSVMEFVTVCLGLFIIINGATKVNYGLWLKRGSEDSWLVTLVTGIFLVVLGIMVVFNPFSAFTLTQLSGAFLIIVGILNVSDTILFKKRAKEIMEIFW
ncbi:MAG TPA: DUF308 domain-containing protein [Candidatus Onthocola stercoravium]|nr:DUF308 domain-containing protein [Candidatus Onthocola stercoravium]